MLSPLKIDWTPEEIRAFRLTLGVTQTKLAELLGTDRQQSVSDWERGLKPRKSSLLLLGYLYRDHQSPSLTEGK